MACGIRHDAGGDHIERYEDPGPDIETDAICDRDRNPAVGAVFLSLVQADRCAPKSGSLSCGSICGNGSAPKAENRVTGILHVTVDVGPQRHSSHSENRDGNAVVF